MANDPEAIAIARVVEALMDLEEDARRRVIRWAAERFGVEEKPPKEHKALSPGGPPPAFTDVAELIGAASPETEAEKALVAGYWFQVCNNEADFESYPLNSALKQLGHGVTNITRALDALINSQPQQVIQVRKAGISKQARKRYRLTAAGIERVRGLTSRQ